MIGASLSLAVSATSNPSAEAACSAKSEEKNVKKSVLKCIPGTMCLKIIVLIPFIELSRSREEDFPDKRQLAIDSRPQRRQYDQWGAQ